MRRTKSRSFLNMQTITSRPNLVTSYPCVVHLLKNGERFEFEYDSEHTGRELLNFLCKTQHLNEMNIWGLKYLDTSGMVETRHWLVLDERIKSQLKTYPAKLYFRVKVYPPEPYRIKKGEIKHQIFQQLRLDLLSGRLVCESKEAAMLVALILQYTHGNYNTSLNFTYLSYIKERILRQERISIPFFLATQSRALELYKNLLGGLSKPEIEDMFLRLASKLDSYGMELFRVNTIDRRQVVLYMNCNGLVVLDKQSKLDRFLWNEIVKIDHQDNKVFVYFPNKLLFIFECFNNAECEYIWSIAADHLTYFRHTPLNRAVGVCPNSDERRFATRKRSSAVHLVSKENLLPKGFFKELHLNRWKSQISVLYVLFLLYLMGFRASIFAELPYMESVREHVNGFVSKLLFNKMLTM